MRILVYRPDADAPAWARDIGAALPRAETVVWREGEGERDDRLDCDYAVVWAPPPALLARLDKARAIFVMGAGVDALLRHGAALPDVPIVRLGDAGMAEQMADYVAYAVLRYFRRFDAYDEQARRGEWQPLEPRAKDEFTVGVLGLGQLGAPVARRLRGLGFPVRGWSRTPKDIDGVACHAGLDALDGFLAGTRVLACLLPLTPDTTNLLDHARLACLPRGAYLVNVARGAQVDEPALLALVRSGHIAGATLDVFHDEPLPAAHPFWSEPRITITPHISAVTLRPDAVRQVVDKIARLERGELVPDVVDRARGY